MSWIQIWKKSKRFYGWRHVSRACDSLSIKYDHQHPKLIVALARGGLVPGTIMANKLGVRHVHSLGISSYEEIPAGGKPGEFDLYQRLPCNNKRLDRDDVVLVVDDISDRGDTFVFAEEYIRENIGGTIVTMSLLVKPETKFLPTYYHEQVPQDQWIVFPWEKK